jgi:hypothetical protein
VYISISAALKLSLQLFFYSRVRSQVSQSCTTDDILPFYDTVIPTALEDLGVDERTM